VEIRYGFLFCVSLPSELLPSAPQRGQVGEFGRVLVVQQGGEVPLAVRLRRAAVDGRAEDQVAVDAVPDGAVGAHRLVGCEAAGDGGGDDLPDHPQRALVREVAEAQHLDHPGHTAALCACGRRGEDALARIVGQGRARDRRRHAVW
jgi:hypothetical protein